jgi:hypothetical protein
MHFRIKTKIGKKNNIENFLEFLFLKNETVCVIFGL